MTTVMFLAEWALRSSILILSGGLLLWLLRVKDPSTRLAVWTAVLAGSLAAPLLTAVLPKIVFRVPQHAAPEVQSAVAVSTMPATPTAAASQGSGGAATRTPFPWDGAALGLYGVVTLGLLLRLAAGLWASRRLARASRGTGRVTEGIPVLETEDLSAPVTLGVLRPVIVLPADWREWAAGRLEAVLAHERAHVRRHDPTIQAVSMVQRALLWFSPLSWFLHTRIVRTAEEASDDAAVAAVGDRVLYAEVLLDFTRKGARGAPWLSVPMARYGPPDQRIHRILDGTALSRGITRWTVGAILAVGSPLMWVVASAHPQDAAPARAAAVPAVTAQAPAEVQSSAPAARPQLAAKYISAMGNAVPSASVTVVPRVEGVLQSINFKEGDTVEAGQLLATIDSTSDQTELSQTQLQLQGVQAALVNAESTLARLRDLASKNAIPRAEADQQAEKVKEVQAQVQALEQAIEASKLRMSYSRIVAPIGGIVGFRKLDPGNMVHPGEATPIVTINQLKPMMVVFDIPEDRLPEVRARLAEGKSLMVEAWNRDSSTRLAVGRLVAVDNQIDTTSGTVKLKAEFDNKNGVLYPNQFVNARLLLPQ